MRYFAVIMTLAAVLAGCATTKARTTTAPQQEPASVDITGPWAGSWDGYGTYSIKRHDAATADFTQQANRGYGRLILEGTLAADSVPLSLRFAGLSGVPVLIDVNGDRVMLRHELGDHLLKGEFRVEGDRMVGRLANTDPPVDIALERVRQRAAVPPPPPAPPVVAAAPTPPPPPAAEAPPAAPAPAPVVATPAPTLPSPQEFTAVAELKSVYFDFDRADIRASDAATLDADAQWLQSNREVLVLIEGHCDERGTEAYNLALGERRAKAVRDHLVAHGVAADRITTVSYGEERPVCREATEECWRQNRRAAFLVKPK